MDLGTIISAIIGSFIGASIALWLEERKQQKNKVVTFNCPKNVDRKTIHEKLEEIRQTNTEI